MYKNILCMNVSEEFGIPVTEQIKMLKKIGFEGFFTGWKRKMNVEEIRKTADDEGMIYQSIHAPFYKAAEMWKEREEAKEAIDELIECISVCEKYNVPVMIVHTFIGFKDHTPTDCGVENYRIVIEAAKRAGVKIAFENTEGEEYLERLMTEFKSYDNVGFCWDTGHEMCYNHSQDMMAKYGDKLIATHINDNLGISDFDGEIIWTDDLHLLPFDGVADWEGITKRLNDHNYNGILTFELNKKSKPGRHENDKYEKMTLEEYFTESYIRACRIAVLKEKNKR